MKIFFAFSASAIDRYIAQKPAFQAMPFDKALMTLVNRSLFNSLHCTEATLSGNSLSILDSHIMQEKWALKQGLSFNNDWQHKVLGAQIEEHSPDVVYTNNPSWYSKHNKLLPDVRLKVAWRAAPVSENDDFSSFQLGLSYASHYLDLLKSKGVKNTELLQFSFDTTLKDRLAVDEEDIDICFVGRYIKMFSKRNQLLKDIYRTYKGKYNIRFHLLTGRRLKGLVPDLPFGLLSVYRKPVFLDDLLNVFLRSKIIINAHSNIAGNFKGNMRVFEALGTGSFMLSDEGNYPDNIVAGKHFAAYNDNIELIEKIGYYMKNESERKFIANNGLQTISNNYSTQLGYTRLKKLFEHYCI